MVLRGAEKIRSQGKGVQAPRKEWEGVDGSGEPYCLFLPSNVSNPPGRSVKVFLNEYSSVPFEILMKYINSLVT